MNVEVQILWQVQHLVNLEVQILWQAQHLVKEVFSELDLEVASSYCKCSAGKSFLELDSEVASL